MVFHSVLISEDRIAITFRCDVKTIREDFNLFQSCLAILFSYSKIPTTEKLLRISSSEVEGVIKSMKEVTVPVVSRTSLQSSVKLEVLPTHIISNFQKEKVPYDVAHGRPARER